MHLLAIETSCDETSAAVLSDLEVLSNIVLSQDEIHAPYGGIVPELASRQHLKSIGFVVEESLSRAKRKLDQIDVFAVTQGPGLVGSLLVGLSFAKGLAFYYRKPLVGIDHVEAHIKRLFWNMEISRFPLSRCLFRADTPPFSASPRSSTSVSSAKRGMMRQAKPWTKSQNSWTWDIPEVRLLKDSRRKVNREGLPSRYRE